MNGTVNCRFFKKSALALAISASTVSAFAQEQQAVTGAEASDIEIIQVSARKRVETIQDIPGVVNVVTAEQLRANGQTDAKALAQNIPGVIYSETFAGASGPRITIRGVGDDDFNPNGSSSAAIHVNGIYQGTNGLLSNQYFDVERVEVLKGPQGTLYGRNATAGAINIVTRSPGFEQGGYIDVDLGDYGLVRTEGAIDLPVSDTFLVRFAGLYESSDGYYTHLGTGPLTDYSYKPGLIPPQQEVPAQGSWGGADRFAGRFTADIDATEQTAIKAIITFGRDKSELPIPDVTADIWADYADVAFFLNPQDPALIAYGDALDNDPFTVFANTLPQLDNSQFGANVNIEHSFNNGINGNLVLGYESLDRTYNTSDNLPIHVADYLFDNDFSQFTIEGRLSGKVADNVNWLLGAFILDDEITFGTNLQFLNSGLWQTDIQTNYVQERSSLGVFLSSDWAPVDWFTLETGIRYSDDEVTFVGQTKNLDPYGVFGTPPAFFPPGAVYVAAPISPDEPVVFDESLDDSEVTWKVSGILKPSNSVSIYATASTGYKAGGFDGSTILSPQEALPINSETVDAYELGVKYWTKNQAFTMEGNLFQYNFDDYQSTATLNVAGADTNVRANVADAKIQGAEFAISATLFESVRVNAGAAFIDGKIENFLGSGDSVEGNDLPFSPDLSWNASIVYNTELTETIGLKLQLDASHTGEHFQTIENNDQVNSYTISNARAELQMADWKLALWVRNLTDEDYDVGFFPTTGLTPDTYLKGAPRSVGLNILYHF